MTEIKSKIAAKIHEFDLICLLQLLQQIGYQPENIQFKSHFSACSQPGLIHGIEFKDNSEPRVVISLNLGLLSAQSPLPSYFFKKLDSGYVDIRAFAEFIGFFDHYLIKNYLAHIYPETNRAFFPDWEMTKLRFIQLLDLKSCSTLHWIFQLVFPELGIKARKARIGRKLSTSHLKLGKTVIGKKAIFGSKTNIPVSGRTVTLVAENESTGSGEPWLREIRKRLNELIFPILCTVGLDLEVLLVILSQKTHARLQTDSYLGYDRIRGGRRQYRRIRIFSGRLSS